MALRRGAASTGPGRLAQAETGPRSRRSHPIRGDHGRRTPSARFCAATGRGSAFMKAICWMGKNSVRVENVPEPEMLNARDAIVKISSTAICGSDLHLYQGYV